MNNFIVIVKVLNNCDGILYVISIHVILYMNIEYEHCHEDGILTRVIIFHWLNVTDQRLTFCINIKYLKS